jgi:hypothetical protein
MAHGKMAPHYVGNLQRGPDGNLGVEFGPGGWVPVPAEFQQWLDQAELTDLKLRGMGLG